MGLFASIVNSSNILKFSLYADDSNIGNSGPDIRTLVQSTNQELAHVYNWIISNYLSANNTKLIHLLFSPDSSEHHYELKLGNCLIPRAQHTKLLGVIMDDRLKWNHHSTHVANILRKLNGVLHFCRRKLSTEALKIIY